jgi:putative aldouronate transport system permease protein
MLLPGLIWYVTYNYVPMYGLTIAFRDYKIAKGILGSPWATPWYHHFQKLFAAPSFGTVLRNTAILSVYRIFYGTIASLTIALVINECRIDWFKRLVQTLNFGPFFLSWVVVYGIFVGLFSQQTGLISRWIQTLGGQIPPLLQSTKWFRSVMVGTSIWKNGGYGAVIYLAALAGIDPSLYEAAVVDGANRLQLIWHVSLPAIRGVIIMLLILNLGSLLMAGFEQVFVFYNVRVYEVADIIDTWVYRQGLERLNFSISVAMGLFQAVIGFIMVFSANRLASRWGESRLW